MIRSKLPPSRFLGSVATTVSCPAFACFVSTSRCAFLTSYWETAIFELSPSNDLKMKLRIRFGYPCKLRREGSELLHDMICTDLDRDGEISSEPLSTCLGRLTTHLRQEGTISWVTIY